MWFDILKKDPDSMGMDDFKQLTQDYAPEEMKPVKPAKKETFSGIPSTPEEYDRSTYFYKHKYHIKEMKKAKSFDWEYVRFVPSYEGMGIQTRKVYGPMYNFHKRMAGRAKTRHEGRRHSKGAEPIMFPKGGYSDYETEQYRRAYSDPDYIANEKPIFSDYP
jgi:hypothetical protein